MKKDNVEKILYCRIGDVGIVITIIAAALTIFMHVHWWIGWLSFLISIGAFVLRSKSMMNVQELHV